jgi:protease-4
MSAMLSQLGEPGIYDAPRQSENWSASQPHMLTMDLEGSVSELASVSLWGGSTSVGLRTLQDRLQEIASNEQVKSLLLRVDGFAIGMAAAQELRASLIAFKGEGKRALHCHTEGISNVSYYLLSACDSIALANTGELMISGVAAMPMHLKGLLDKLGIKADFLHVGDYKGAAEPLTLDKPSDAMNETLGAILDQSYATLVAGIAQGRGLSPETVQGLVDRAMFNSQEAIEAKLVDQEATYEAFRAEKAGDLPWKQVGLKDKKSQGFGELMDLVGLKPRERSNEQHVAVVYALGNIVDGAGDGMLGAREEIASHTMIATLGALAEADSVKAVVLRVDSGGGSALASELIWHAVQALKDKKPVVVSMGGVAASGGYYISAGANRIFADENTLTGSIGVVGGKLAIGGALEKFGVKSFPIGRGKRSMMWSTMRSWNAEERAIVQTMMEDIYKIFVQRVAAGRGKSFEQIHELAQGRVWTGSAALANGLVDELGGLDAAVAHATKLAGLDVSGELEIYPPEPRLTDYVSSYTSGVSLSSPELLAQLLQQAHSLLGADAATVLARTLRQVSSFQTSAVQTTLLLPVVWN